MTKPKVRKRSIEVVHQCPPEGSGVTPCCGRTPFELPRTDRMSIDTKVVTCHALDNAFLNHVGEYLKRKGWLPMVASVEGIEQGSALYNFVLRIKFTGKRKESNAA